MFHILFALASVGYATYAYVAPTRRHLHYSYGLMALTVASGVSLVVVQPVHLASACTSGLVYGAGVAISTILTHRRLAVKETE